MVFTSGRFRMVIDPRLWHGSRSRAMEEGSDAPQWTAVERWVMPGFIIAFAVKLPMIMLHAWLPDAHAEAPTAGGVILE